MNIRFQALALPLAVSALLSFSPLVISEEIKIGLSKQAPEQSNMVRPQRGMKQKEVINLFGQPKVKDTPKGTPPISTWHYESFSVYFESNTVIHSVLKHVPEINQATQ